MVTQGLNYFSTLLLFIIKQNSSDDDNAPRKLSSKIYSSNYPRLQSRSDVLDVVYDESDFLLSNFEYDSENEFSKTKNVLNKIKNYPKKKNWNRVGQQIDRQFDIILSLANSGAVQVRNWCLLLSLPLE